MGQWCELPVDLVMMIEEQLILYIDKVRFRAVCDSWNAILTKIPNLQLPCLFHNLYENEDATHGLFNLHDRKIHLLNLPNVKGNLFLGSSNGRLGTIDYNNSSMCLKNPLNGCSIEIPPSNKFGVVEIVYRYNVFTNKKIVLSPPTLKDDCMAVAIYDGRRLAYCKCHDEKWKTLSDGDVKDIIFHKGKLYVLLDGFGLAIYDYENIDPTNVTMIASDLSLDTVAVCYSYLVESSAQELMMIVKETRCLFAVYAEHPGESLRETLFHVYKYDPVKQAWDKMGSIGDEVIFVDHMSATSVSSCSFPGLKGNQIYFINEDCCVFHYHHQQEKSKIEVFNLDDETSESLSDFEINHMQYTHFPVWVTPSLF